MKKMLSERTITKRYLKIGFFSIIILIIVFYAIWRTYNYALGPSITISSPISNTTNEKTIHISGIAKRVNFLSLNDYPISLDEQGNFDEEILMYNGMNIISIKAKDRFDRQIEQKIEIWRQ